MVSWLGYGSPNASGRFCHLGRIGPFLSNRIVITEPTKGVFSPRVANSWRDWFMRIISWIYSPASYTEQNRKTIQCFREMLKDVGDKRLSRICQRYNIDLAKMEKEGSPLLSRTIAKISVGIQDVKIRDIDEVLEKAKENPPRFPHLASDALCLALQTAQTSDELSSEHFASLYEVLSCPADSFLLPPMEEINGSAPTEFLARFFFDQFLADRERLGLQAEHPMRDHEVFAHNVSVRLMRREMEVGMLIPAPSRHQEPIEESRLGCRSRRKGVAKRPSETEHEKGSKKKIKQFYRVAARLVTGEGLVSYVLVPATPDTDLVPIQFYRGTSLTPAEVDALSSLITDLEPHLGDTAWKSSKIYRYVIAKYLPHVQIVAGHSLGSTLAQRAIVKNPRIREGWLFHGPGLSDKKITEFNERMEKPQSRRITLHIRDAEDDLSLMGHLHLGYQAPEKVTRDFLFYSAAQKAGRFSVHTTMWHNQAIYGMAGGHEAKDIDYYLNHKGRVSFNWLREAVGPYLLTIFRLIRNFFRWLIGSRVRELRGLQLGVYQRIDETRGEKARFKWTVHNIKPQNVTKVMAANYPVRV